MNEAVAKTAGTTGTTDGSLMASFGKEAGELFDSAINFAQKNVAKVAATAGAVATSPTSSLVLLGMMVQDHFTSSANASNAPASNTVPDLKGEVLKWDGRTKGYDVNDHVMDAQRKLKAMGFNVGPIDGKNGPLTTAAMKQFQRVNDLDDSGEINQITFDKIYEEYNALSPEDRAIAKTSAPAAPAQKQYMPYKPGTKAFDGANSNQQETLAGIGAPLEKLLITSPFGPRNITNGSKNHKAVDFRTNDNPNQSVLAAGDGTVSFVGNKTGYGKIVMIDHGNDIKTHYAHLSKFANIKVGDKISKGEAIGKPGGTGYLNNDNQRYTEHLDFGIRINGKRINPEPILEANLGPIRHKGEEQNAFKQRQDTFSQQNTQIASHSHDTSTQTASRSYNGETSRGIENNNPLNIDYHKSNDWKGQTGIESGGRFAKFSEAEYGFRAAAHLLGKTYQGRYGIDNVKDVVNKWAPSKENGIEATNKYINNVSNEMGVRPEQKLDLSNPNTMKKLIKAMVKQENGYQPYDDKTIEKGIEMAGIKGRSPELASVAPTATPATLGLG